jgi:aminoglycoside 3-N-acetyltransferase
MSRVIDLSMGECVRWGGEKHAGDGPSLKRLLSGVQVGACLSAAAIGSGDLMALFITREDLRRDLERLGLRHGDTVMVHAAMSKVGRLLNGPDAMIGAILDATAPGGTLMAYIDWDARYDELLDAEGRVPEAWRAHVPPFDPRGSRALRENGILAEFVRTAPGARRSCNPGASVAAIGAKAEWLTADHPPDYGYGEGSPFARLVEADGKVLMVGAPLDTMTLLHHAEHRARIPGKRVKRYEVPFATAHGTDWRMVEEFDTSVPIVSGLPDDYFATIGRDYLATGAGREGLIGNAPSVLVEAAAITTFAVTWLEQRFGDPHRSSP